MEAQRNKGKKVAKLLIMDKNSKFMESRKQREREYHDKAFIEGTREKVNKFYLIGSSVKDRYTEYLLERGKNRKVLEYGCGQGGRSFLLARNSADVTGIDISSVAVEKSREKAKRENLGSIKFLVMDAESLEFEDNSFDVIFGSGILHHLNLKKAFREISRTLRPDGSAIFIEPLGHNPLINLYRKKTPSLRTRDEHPLRVEDIKTAERYFKNVSVRYYYLFSLCAVPFRNMFYFKKLLRLCEIMDRAVFTVMPFMRRFAWQVLIILSAPRKVVNGTH